MDRARVTVLTVALLLPFLGLEARLVQMQLVEPETFIGNPKRSSNLEVLRPQRGKIIDSKGRVLAQDVRSFDCYLVLEEYEKNPGALPRLIEMSPDEFQEKVEKMYRKIERVIQRRPRKEWRILYRRERRTPYLLKRNIRFEAAMAIETVPHLYAGGEVRESLIREYPVNKKPEHPHVACHLLGYLGRVTSGKGRFETLCKNGYFTRGFDEVISKRDIDRLIRRGAFHEELIGTSGLEKKYNDALRGEHGVVVFEREPGTTNKRMIELKPAVPGKDLELTIDIKVQKRVEEILHEHPLTGLRAAAVVLDPHTGGVVALASNRGFNPNDFTPPGDKVSSARVTAALQDNDGRPMRSRACQDQYALGSIFKVVIAVAGLEEGKVTPEELIACRGKFDPSKRFFNCWIWNNYRGMHGELALHEALERSCNCYFYTLGRRCSFLGIAKWAFKMGYGEKTGIDLPGEVRGNVPRQQRWTNDDLSLSIGQHELMVSPLQAARMLAVVCNGGKKVRPHVNRAMTTDPQFAPQPLGIAPETLETVKQGLYCVTHEPQGTAHGSGLSKYAVAGKTSTAQAGGDRTHAWFAGYAPYDDPKYVVVVFVQHGGHGGATAAPPAKKIFMLLLGDGEAYGG